jgi:hypothetical protein
MSALLIKISKDFATLWTTIDPIGNVALFAGLTAALTRSERHLTAMSANPSAPLKLGSSRAHSPLPTAALPSMSFSPRTLHSLTRDLLCRSPQSLHSRGYSEPTIRRVLYATVVKIEAVHVDVGL